MYRSCFFVCLREPVHFLLKQLCSSSSITSIGLPCDGASDGGPTGSARCMWTGSARISPECTSIAELLRETFGGGLSKSMIVPDKLDNLRLNAMGSCLMWAGGSFEEVATDGALGAGCLNGIAADWRRRPRKILVCYFYCFSNVFKLHVCCISWFIQCCDSLYVTFIGFPNVSEFQKPKTLETPKKNTNHDRQTMSRRDTTPGR